MQTSLKLAIKRDRSSISITRIRGEVGNLLAYTYCRTTKFESIIFRECRQRNISRTQWILEAIRFYIANREE